MAQAAGAQRARRARRPQATPEQQRGEVVQGSLRQRGEAPRGCADSTRERSARGRGALPASQPSRLPQNARRLRGPRGGARCPARRGQALRGPDRPCEERAAGVRSSRTGRRRVPRPRRPRIDRAFSSPFASQGRARLPSLVPIPGLSKSRSKTSRVKTKPGHQRVRECCLPTPHAANDDLHWLKPRALEEVGKRAKRGSSSNGVSGGTAERPRRRPT